MSEIPRRRPLQEALGSDYRLIDFDRHLYGLESLNIINSNRAEQPLLGWTVRHEFIAETGMLAGLEVPTPRVVLNFHAAGDSKPAIVMTCVCSSLDTRGWEMYVRNVEYATTPASALRSLANRLIDGLLRETAARSRP